MSYKIGDITYVTAENASLGLLFIPDTTRLVLFGLKSIPFGTNLELGLSNIEIYLFDEVLEVSPDFDVELFLDEYLNKFNDVEGEYHFVNSGRSIITNEFEGVWQTLNRDSVFYITNWEKLVEGRKMIRTEQKQ